MLHKMTLCPFVPKCPLGDTAVSESSLLFVLKHRFVLVLGDMTTPCLTYVDDSILNYKSYGDMASV